MTSDPTYRGENEVVLILLDSAATDLARAYTALGDAAKRATFVIAESRVAFENSLEKLDRDAMDLLSGLFELPPKDCLLDNLALPNLAECVQERVKVARAIPPKRTRPGLPWHLARKEFKRNQPKKKR